MKQPRKLKKAIKKAIITYDICSRPDGIDSFERLLDILHNTGFLFYDETKGSKPTIYKKEKRIKIRKDYKNYGRNI